MKSALFYISLILDKLTGRINKQNELLLNELITKDEKLKEKWNALQSKYPAKEVQRINGMNWIPAEEITALPQIQNVD